MYINNYTYDDYLYNSDHITEALDESLRELLYLSKFIIYDTDIKKDRKNLKKAINYIEKNNLSAILKGGDTENEI